MHTFLEEFMSAYCRFAIPTAVIIPNMTMKTPPMIGSGMVTNSAPNLPSMPKIINKNQAETSNLSRYEWEVNKEIVEINLTVHIKASKLIKDRFFPSSFQWLQCFHRKGLYRSHNQMRPNKAKEKPNNTGETNHNLNQSCHHYGSLNLQWIFTN